MQPKNTSIYNPQLASFWLTVKRYYAMNYTFFEMNPHRHAEFEIMYAVHGSCKILCRNKDGQDEVYILKEGEYIVIDCNILHQLSVSRGTPCRILNLEIAITPPENGFSIEKYAMLSSSFQEFLKMPCPVWKGMDNGGSLCRTILELQKQLQNSTDLSEHRIEANLLLAQLLIELARQRMKKSYAYHGSIYVRRALSYIEKNYDGNVSVEEIAEATGISLSYLQRLFHEHTGCTLINKVNEFRIMKSMLLLETSSLPIIDIAVMVGFHNRQHFTFIFTKLAGCSPSLYKKRKGNNQLWLGFDS